MSIRSVKKILCLAVAILIALISSYAHAGWVDDWIQQKTESSPGYFEGQKRGYYYGGSFSARWANTSTDYLFSIQAPKVKFGCGGIDIFGGGFSYLNVDYLVQKIQSMIQAAPAIAFDIALQTLAEQISISSKDFQNIIDRLNQLNFNECQASKAMVVSLMKPMMGNKMPGEYQNAVSDFLQSSGVKGFWNEITKEEKTNNNNPPSADYSDMTKDCPQDIKDIFATAGSVLDNIGNKLGMNTDYIKLIRGLFGDIIIAKDSNNLLVASYQPPCKQNSDKTLDAVKNGDIYMMDSSGNCSKITDTNADLTQWAQNMMDNIVNAMKNSTALTADQENFLKASPLSTGLVLKYAVSTSQESSIIAQMSEITGIAYAYSLLADFYDRVSYIHNKLKEFISKMGNQEASGTVDSTNFFTSGSSTPTYQCRISYTGAPDSIDMFQQNVIRSMNALRKDYANKLKEVGTIYEYISTMEKFDAFSMKEISYTFGTSVANRVASGLM